MTPNFVPFTTKEIKEIEELAISLFFNNGKLENPGLITKRHKQEICDTFIEFYGQQHKQTIEKRIDDTDIVYIYEMLRSDNSIEKCLQRLKGSTFSSRTRFRSYEGQLFETISEEIDKCDGDLDKVAKENPLTFEMLMDAMRVRKKDLCTPLGKYAFIRKVKHYAQVYDNCYYSYNYQENEICKKLYKYVLLYKLKLIEYFEETSENKHEAHAKFISFLNDPERRINTDPLVKYSCDKHFLFFNSQDYAKKKILIDKHCLALHIKKPFDMGSYIVFGAFPSDDTVLHEAQHAVDQAAFLKGTDGKRMRHPTLEIKNQIYKHHEPFNEAVTSFLASKMVKHRKKIIPRHIMSNQSDSTGYSPLVNCMSNFLDAYLDDLKEIIFTPDPVETLKHIIGRFEYEKLAQLCSDVLTYYHKDNKALCSIKKAELIELSNSIAKRKTTSLPKKKKVWNMFNLKNKDEREM